MFSCHKRQGSTAVVQYGHWRFKIRREACIVIESTELVDLYTFRVGDNYEFAQPTRSDQFEHAHSVGV